MELSTLTKPLSASSTPFPRFPTPSNALQHFSSTLQAPSPSPTTRPLPTNLSIQPITTSTLPSFKRLISILLPIRYPEKFFSETLSSLTTSSLSRIAIWYDSARPGKRKRPDSDDADDPDTGEWNVVGAIRCRLEDVPQAPGENTAEMKVAKQVYVQTLGVLSPYRSLGAASALLEEIVEVGIREYSITSVYAHVWEANTEALQWYMRRGFKVEKGIVEGYYRRLRPAGARVVRRVVGVSDYIRAEKQKSAGAEEADGIGDGCRGDGPASSQTIRVDVVAGNEGTAEGAEKTPVNDTIYRTPIIPTL